MHIGKRMKKLIAVGLFGLLVPMSGCIVHSHGPGHGRYASSSRPQCHPSQYWDGHQCRHKGQGSGARKHDGR
jgi:hypothetical protein